MLISEAIKRTRQIIDGTGYDYISATINVRSYQDRCNETDCNIYVGGKSGESILRAGRNFKEALFLLECAINVDNEEDQDDGN